MLICRKTALLYIDLLRTGQRKVASTGRIESRTTSSPAKENKAHLNKTNLGGVWLQRQLTKSFCGRLDGLVFLAKAKANELGAQ